MKYLTVVFSPKCYWLNNETDIKRSHKGTPRHVDLKRSDYESAMFDNNVKKATFNKIIYDRRLGTNTTKQTTRKTVNPIYLKMRVMDDLITIKPHSTDAGLL